MVVLKTTVCKRGLRSQVWFALKKFRRCWRDVLGGIPFWPYTVLKGGGFKGFRV